jgi:amidase
MSRGIGEKLLILRQAYVGRILQVNSTLHMVTEINLDAWTIPKQLDAERANGTLRG